MREDKREQAITMLKRKQDKIGRLPKKSDFEPHEVSFIKSVLGPWPRALEAAELKPVSRHYIEKKVRNKQRNARKRMRNTNS